MGETQTVPRPDIKTTTEAGGAKTPKVDVPKSPGGELAGRLKLSADAKAPEKVSAAIKEVANANTEAGVASSPGAHAEGIKNLIATESNTAETNISAVANEVATPLQEASSSGSNTDASGEIHDSKPAQRRQPPTRPPGPSGSTGPARGGPPNRPAGPQTPIVDGDNSMPDAQRRLIENNGKGAEVAGTPPGSSREETPISPGNLSGVREEATELDGAYDTENKIETPEETRRRMYGGRSDETRDQTARRLAGGEDEWAKLSKEQQGVREVMLASSDANIQATMEYYPDSKEFGEAVLKARNEARTGATATTGAEANAVKLQEIAAKGKSGEQLSPDEMKLLLESKAPVDRYKVLSDKLLNDTIDDAERKELTDLNNAKLAEQGKTEATTLEKTPLEELHDKTEALWDKANDELDATGRISAETDRAIAEAEVTRMALEAGESAPDARERAKNATEGGGSKRGQEFYNKIRDRLQQILENRELMKKISETDIPTLRMRLRALKIEYKGAKGNEDKRYALFVQIGNIKGQLIGKAGEGHKLLANNLQLEHQIKKITGVNTLMDSLSYSVNYAWQKIQAWANEEMEEKGLEQDGVLAAA